MKHISLRSPTEFQEASALMSWVLLHENAEPKLQYLLHVPNGDFRSPRTGGKLKKMGVRPGVSDYFLASPMSHVIPGSPEPWQYHGCWIELKKLGGQNDVTPGQWAWLGAMASQGYATMVCAGWVEAAKFLCWYLKREDLAQQL